MNINVIGRTKFAAAVRAIVSDGEWEQAVLEGHSFLVNREANIWVPLLDKLDIGEALARAAESYMTYIQVSSERTAYTPAEEYIVEDDDSSRSYQFL